eukprot:TRINITY_DN21504_c0_g1_i1.p1 TRINITY_DN21504_c0_g1~~TRINITY_DN21504_c0_g1_i1.p1  ORF type:complete len:298 (-),score=63.52 TRINITY_DN21504_c0_g1_i1:99-920(-)
MARYSDDEESSDSGGEAAGELRVRQFLSRRVSAWEHLGIALLAFGSVLVLVSICGLVLGRFDGGDSPSPASNGDDENLPLAERWGPPPSEAQELPLLAPSERDAGLVPLEDGHIKTLWHTTTPEIANKILDEGFHPGRNGWCGGAIYFYGHPKLPKTKLGPDSGTGAVIEARVDLGRSAHLDRRCKGGARQDVRSRYDSIIFNPGDGAEYIVFSKDRILSMKMYDKNSHEEEEEEKRTLRSGTCCWLGGSCYDCAHGSEFVWAWKCTSSRRCA